ncbi:MAG TPA: hydroxyacid dehydrogenase [Planctomycetota bacterium]|jgi:D-3-phosphoglycerate dehydrogenase
MKTKPAVLLTENIHPKYLAKLERYARVVRPPDLSQATLINIAAAEQIQAIIVRTKGDITREVLAASPHLKVVGRHGIGVDHIDLSAATEHGVWVVNTPGASRVAAAEHTWAMILALAKNIPAGDSAVRSGDFGIRERRKSLQLEGKTLGVIGLGRIGTTVATTAVKGFGMRLLYNDLLRFPVKERRLGARKVSLKALLSKSDIVTIHTPLDESTRGMIGARQLAWMKPTAFFVNCARGAIVDASAVADALKRGKLAGAAFDVFVPEVPPPDHPLLNVVGAVLSPHCAAQTAEANLGYAAVVEDVLRVLAGRVPKFPVNSPQT